MPKFIDIDSLGRTALPKPRRGLEALIPTSPAPDVRAFQWTALENALQGLNAAQLEYEAGRPGLAADRMLEVRRALGTLALTLSDEPDAEGYARLLGNIMTTGTTGRGDQ